MKAVPVYLSLPLLFALIYSIAVLALKRAMEEGADRWQVVISSILTTTVMLSPLLFVVKAPGPTVHIFEPLVAGTAFFLGMALNVLALNVGDVSVATPLMGAKVLFVAFFTILIISKPVSPLLWFAAILATMALALLREPGQRKTGRFWPTVGFALGSAASFAMCDISFQRWARPWGMELFLSCVFGVASVLALVSMPFAWRGKAPLSSAARKWLAAGCILFGLQTMGMLISIGSFHHPNAATAINIVFSSRGIWSVVLVWAVGQWFGNIERTRGTAVMVRRLVGSMLLTAAIALTLTQG